MNKTTGFHVRHDLRPQLTQELLALLNAAESPRPEAHLHQLAEDRGYRLRDRKSYRKILLSLSELRILSISSEGIELTELGYRISNISQFYPHLLSEFIHFLYYSAWDMSKSKRFSWSYRSICDWLWESAPCVIDRDRLVTLVTHRASREFGEKGVSFSTSSVTGVLNWIAELQPSCVRKMDGQQVFSLRPYCPVESFALSLNHIYHQHACSINPYIKMSPNIRKEVCRISLISEHAFDEMMEQTEACFENLDVRRERGSRFAMHNFSWGRLEE